MSTKQSPQLARILGTIAEGNHYEAHQQCISVYQRYVRQKRIKMAKGLLYEASMALLKADAMGSGIDLANCFAKLLDEQTALPLDEATASELMRLFDLMDLEHAQVAFFMKYCKKLALGREKGQETYKKWSHHFGSRYVKEKMYADAEPLFLEGTEESAKALGQMLHEWAESEFPEERQFVITRDVLQFLADGNLNMAGIVFESFTESLLRMDAEWQLGSVEIQPHSRSNAREPSETQSVRTYKLPLLNFCQMLMFAAQRRVGSLYYALRKKYDSLLSLEADFDSMLTVIAQIFFGIKPKTDAMFPGMLGNLMQSFLGGGGGGGGGGLFPPQASNAPTATPQNPGADLD